MADFIVPTPELPPQEAFDQQFFLDLFQRILPNHYLENMLPPDNGGTPPGPGWELFQTFAKLGERASEAVARFGTGSYILSAPGGAKATATVEFFRDDASAGAFNLEPGSRVRTTDGWLYTLTQQVVFGASDLGPHAATVEAIGQGYGWNCEGPITTADGTLIPGPLRIIVSTEQSPTPLIELHVQVRQVTPAIGGVDPSLDLLGNDRGITRLPGEDDDTYRQRIRSLSETVTPDAILAALQRYMGTIVPIGGEWSVFESWEAAACYDYPQPVPPGYTAGSTAAGNFSYVNPQGRTVVAPFVWDDPRDIIDSNLDLWWDNSLGGGLIVVLQGVPAGQEAAYAAGVISVLDKIRAAGVSVIVLIIS